MKYYVVFQIKRETLEEIIGEEGTEEKMQILQEEMKKEKITQIVYSGKGDSSVFVAKTNQNGLYLKEEDLPQISLMKFEDQKPAVAKA
jgi:hypothetical protein